MKRFLIFSGLNYYPSGGWGDFRSSHDTLKEAQKVMKEKNSAYYQDWGQIVDVQTGEIVDQWGSGL